MSRPTLKQLYAKDSARRRGRARNPVGKKFVPPDPNEEPGFRSTAIESRNSDGQTTAWYVYRCVHCHEYEGEHPDGCCLFLPTKFQEMTAAQSLEAFPPEPPTLQWPVCRQVGKSTSYSMSTTYRGIAVHTTVYDEID